MALKIRLHCEGCMQKMKRIILKIKGKEIDKSTKLLRFSTKSNLIKLIN